MDVCRLSLIHFFDAVYDDYKFVTRAELEEMNLSQLIGSSLLKAYMHGFFMDIRLYQKVSKTYSLMELVVRTGVISLVASSTHAL